MKIEDYKELLEACNELENKTKYCAFFDYSGHVKWADFSVSLNKEKYNKMVSLKNMIMIVNMRMLIKSTFH